MHVPDATTYDPMLGSTMYTGTHALDAFGVTYNGGPVAIDIETRGLDPFAVKCLTASWVGTDGRTHAVLLDPIRRTADGDAARRIIHRSDALVLHNSPFDMPPLVHYGLADRDDVFKVWDTIVLARLRWPDVMLKKNLESTVTRMKLATFLDGALARSIKASGLKTQDRWYADADIDRPVYRFGAMADTVYTLRLLSPLIDSIHDYLTDHPFTERGLQTAAQAQEIVDREMTTHRVMLWRSCRGIRVDMEYMHTYRDGVADKIARAEHTLREAGMEPGNGAQLVAHLDSLGALPQPWPRTEKKGELKSDKAAMAKLGDHPLAVAHTVVAEEGRIAQYLDSVAARAEVTGRCHPQVGILAASATGRMAYSDPPLQQFSADARPMLADDGEGIVSVDWSSIEPVVVANMAGDHEFLDPFVNGADLYEPIQRSAAIDRKRAKVVLLGTLYGEGKTKLAADLKCTPEQATMIQRQMFAAMPKVERFLETVKAVAAQYRITLTADGRVLSVPVFNGDVASYKATNYITQGTAYSVMSDTINRIHAAGLSDHIYLSMHDELVVAKDAAPEVERIMQTPPEFLQRWTEGRCTQLRTDSNDLGHAWAYV